MVGNSSAPRRTKVIIWQFQVDAIQDGFVEFFDQVGGEEEDPAIILECAKEGSDKSIPLQLQPIASL